MTTGGQGVKAFRYSDEMLAVLVCISFENNGKPFVSAKRIRRNV